MRTYFSLFFTFLLLASCGARTQQKERVVFYSEYGAAGDGVTDDFDAIIKAHEAANEAGLKVRADAGATYYIGAAEKTAQIQTDTDWGDARFIIDDSKLAVENRNSHVFNISSKLSSKVITTIKTLQKNQEKLDLSLPYDSFVEVTDHTTTRYIRWGPDQNNGAPQTDVFVVDKNGCVDMKAPIIWDFDNISAMTVYPIDTETLTVSGGHFTTIANQAEPPYRYYSRGIQVNRSNVVVDGLVHAVTGELDHSAPYSGIVVVSKCANVTVRNCVFSGRKYYSIGTYDISVSKGINVTFRDCRQLNDIHDSKLWGVIGTNYSKNLMYDHVEFSRFDAHMGVANATVKNSVIGYVSMNIIGSGVFLVENTKVCGRSFINLRSDYGSTWDGEVVIRNCDFFPRNGAQSDVILINGQNLGQHDFGYTCHMPSKITIDGLFINDSNPPDDYLGPKIFANFNSDYTSDAYHEKYPYVITKEIVIRNLTVKSGKPYVISNNPYMFRHVRITEVD